MIQKADKGARRLAVLIVLIGLPSTGCLQPFAYMRRPRSSA
jgi:hypothetical protein